MAPKRLPAHRVAGIAAWSAAAVAWGTTLVAMANGQSDSPVEDQAIGLDESPLVEYVPLHAPMPAMPTNGLVVLRYTPVEKPEPATIVRRVVRTGGGGTSQAPITTKSSGS